MLICKGTGKLMVNMIDGDILWADGSSSMETWYGQNGYESVLGLNESYCLDICFLPLPPCKDCPSFKKCCNTMTAGCKIPDNSKCLAVDEKATRESVVETLSFIGSLVN